MHHHNFMYRNTMQTTKHAVQQKAFLFLLSPTTPHHTTPTRCQYIRASADERGVQFTYKSDDGRTKATMEQVFTPDSTPLADGDSTPWQFSWQMNERVLVWNDELKARLVKVVGGSVYIKHQFTFIPATHPPRTYSV